MNEASSATDNSGRTPGGAWASLAARIKGLYALSVYMPVSLLAREGATFRTSTGEHFTVKLEGIESILQELPVPAGPLRTAWDWLNLGDDA